MVEHPRTGDGFVVRPAGPGDRGALTEMLTGLSDLSLYFRFQTAVGRPPRPSLIDPLVEPTGGCWVAEHEHRLVAHAMWAWAHGVTGAPTAELAIVVADPCQGRGLGLRMVALAATHAVAAGAAQFLVVVSAANDRTLRLVRRHWPTAQAERDGALINFLLPATHATWLA
ncbi:GCN5-related N-acetyltransferase [Kribbella flavida DSM 17836]|uniref:GCN5-related N-acetyltransferase n=1 Tax=Kribbella flavida (strain DSM 17836 / JCM 10339 / NBRC 14399) TaxID=479435 RepID=D2PQP7_KRIFD|nr:GCN5-related N-acetyltransferase [Kribbella flavida DSM 17836]